MVDDDISTMISYNNTTYDVQFSGEQCVLSNMFSHNHWYVLIAQLYVS